MRRHRLIEVEWPDFGQGELPAPAEAEEYADRIDRTRAAMAAAGLTHLVVYADREHFANLAWLTGFDPRFEEAMLVLRADGAPVLLVGNENVGRVHASPLHAVGALRSERYQPLSLLSQPRDESRLLRDILDGEGIGAGARVGCAGWKYFSESEHPDARHAMEIPAFVVDTLRELAGREAVVNATALFMEPAGGLRTVCSAAEVAYFEYANTAASEGMKRVIVGLEEGITDLELARRFEYNGLPLSCHVGMKTPGNRAIGLTGPTGSVVRRGGPFSANFGYWGSNICRVGWVARSEAELPEGARDYVEAFAGLYFEAMGEWLSMLRIGTQGGALAAMIRQRLPFERFGVFLNPGHLIHLDEWVSSPIYAGSTDPLRSGMYLQSDVIPRSPVYFGTRMEDGYLLADETLRGEIRSRYPGCHARIQARRDFLIGTLGFEIGEEVLPLSNTAGLVPPYLLAPERVLALEA